MIYRLLLLTKSSGNVVSVTKGMCVPPVSGPQVQNHCPTEPPQLSSQLLRVCRIISQEATVVLYSENVFQTTEPYSLHEHFLPAIGIQNMALLKSVKVDIGKDIIEDLHPYHALFRRAYLDNIAVQDVSVLFKKHIGLGSIQEFSLSFSTPNTLYSHNDFCHHRVVSGLMCQGLHETHTLHKQVERIGASGRITTIKLVKLSPEVCSRCRGVERERKMLTHLFRALQRGLREWRSRMASCIRMASIDGSACLGVLQQP